MEGLDESSGGIVGQQLDGCGDRAAVFGVIASLQHHRDVVTTAVAVIKHHLNALKQTFNAVNLLATDTW